MVVGAQDEVGIGHVLQWCHMNRRWRKDFLVLLGLLPMLMSYSAHAQARLSAPQPSPDARVGQFLESNRNRWRDWNVPF